MNPGRVGLNRLGLSWLSSEPSEEAREAAERAGDERGLSGGDEMVLSLLLSMMVLTKVSWNAREPAVQKRSQQTGVQTEKFFVSK